MAKRIEDNQKKTKIPNFIKVIGRFIWKGPRKFLVSAIVAFVIISPIKRVLQNPDAFIYVIGDFNKEMVNDIYEKFDDRTILSDIECLGVNIKIRNINDGGDPDQVVKLSKKYADKYNTLMIIGHFYSSQTAKALPNYMEALPQIPVILTTETNPNLIHNHYDYKIKLEDYVPIFGLSPDDDNQAEIAANKAHSLGCENFWVIQDINNKVYSNYLTTAFIKKVHEKPQKQVLLRTDNSYIPSIEILEKLDINCVYFAGDWLPGLILVNQINAIYNKRDRPKIILSDGCANIKLINHIIKEEYDNVFLTHPLSMQDFKNPAVGNKYFGEKAAIYVRKMIESAKGNDEVIKWWEKWMGINRVSNVRKAVKEAMFKKFEDDDNKHR
ncbi:ABC transporter substrate-binding protein, partial [Bacteroidota bacterium]